MEEQDLENEKLASFKIKPIFRDIMFVPKTRIIGHNRQ